MINHATLTQSTNIEKRGFNIRLSVISDLKTQLQLEFQLVYWYFRLNPSVLKFTSVYYRSKSRMKEVKVKLRPSSRAAGDLLIPSQEMPKEVCFDLVVAFVKSPGHFYFQLGKF